MSERVGPPDTLREAFIDSRLRSRRSRRDWISAVVVLAVALGAIWVFQTQVERWFLRATFRVMRDEEPKRLDDRLVGRWISATGSRILISRSGVVWAEAGDLMGTGAFDSADASHFTVEGPGFRCLYDLVVKRDVSEWHLLQSSPAVLCPEGRFVRAFTF